MISDDSQDYRKFTAELYTIPKRAYQDCFQKWQGRWERCINAGGEYFEGNKIHSVACPKKIIKK
jgi:hypothetical protein